MAKVRAEAGLTIRIGVGHKKGWGSHDGITPHHQLSIERDYDDSLSDEELEAKALALHKRVRGAVEQLMERDKEALFAVD